MSELPARVRRALLLRSFAVQGSWNYQTLIGTGFAFVVLPALRHVYGGDEARLREALARHLVLFNSHPYLATVAAGAVARLEADGTPPEMVERFKAALRGSLGTMGDRLFWLVWRPAASLLGLAAFLLGGAWWLGALLFLAAYNLLHLPVRAWGLRVGARDGLAVGKALKEAPFTRLGERAADAGAALAGLVAVLAAGRAVQGAPDVAWALPAVAAGVALGFRVRRAAFVLLLAAWLLGLALARTP